MVLMAIVGNLGAVLMKPKQDSRTDLSRMEKRELFLMILSYYAERPEGL